MVNANEALLFVQNNMRKYFSFISKLKGFPFVCDYSSYILGAYLAIHFNLPDDYMEGVFADDENSHCWIEIDGKIIDFTLCQFYGKKIPLKTAKHLSEEELFDAYITNRKISVLVNKNNEIFEEYLFGCNTTIENKWTDIAKESVSFDDYLDTVRIKNPHLFRK